MLIGSETICRYLGIASYTTMIVWVEVYGLPALKCPDGMWRSSVTAIDEWLFLGSAAETANRGYSRGTNNRADIALEQAKKRALRASDRLRGDPAANAAGPVYKKER